MPGRPRKLRIKHVTERDNVISRSGRQMTCQYCPACGSANVVDESGQLVVDESGRLLLDESGVEVQMAAMSQKIQYKKFETENFLPSTSRNKA
ncbi:hypothetical protein Tco_1260520 [Tanacetum coccineum]